MTQEQREEILSLRKDGMSYRAIGIAVGVKQSSVFALCVSVLGYSKAPKLPAAQIDEPIVPASEHGARDFFAALRKSTGYVPSFTQAFCGDPMPGRSALDDRQSGGQ